jgi:hypothetical protein
MVAFNKVLKHAPQLESLIGSFVKYLPTGGLVVTMSPQYLIAVMVQLNEYF